MNKKALINREGIHIFNTISNIIAYEDIETLNAFIQDQLLPNLGAVIWVWYWQRSEHAEPELINVVNIETNSSKSNNQKEFIHPLEEQLIMVISSNSHFVCQDKVILLSLLKKQSLTNVNMFSNTRYKAIIQAPERIGFAILGLNKFSTGDHQLVKMLTPIMLLQKQNLIRKSMMRHYRNLLNEGCEESHLALLDQTFQVIDCTYSLNILLAHDSLNFTEIICKIIGIRKPEENLSKFKIVDNYKSVYRCGRRAYEVLIRAVEFDGFDKQCGWFVRFERLFKEESKGLRQLREAGLTNREIEICSSVNQGESNNDIALKLSISLYTVKNHLKHIFTKLNVSSRWELITLMDGKAGSISGKFK